MKTLKSSLIKHCLIIVFLFICGCDNAKEVTINDKLKVHAELIYLNEFDNDLEDWVIEQMAGGKAEINDGKLEITDVSGCTIWLKNQFEGPIMIEYDVLVIDQGGPQDRVSDLNCFWMAKDPKNMNNLFERSDERGGKFSNYDSLRLYYMGVGGHFNTKTRFRRYVGNGDRPLLPEHDLTSQEYLLTANKPYRIKIIAHNGYIQYYRNEQLLADFYDDEPYTSGHFGFRTVNNHMTVDNFKVYKLSN
ncbi:DUF6250 domain-containing protein [Seonamhaeicola maritimus]|uniref:DUF6250 domain-containing protein n=1 Tax=Seonamhaeicola maritimus TaxID=2591822 RepID=A0A5C7GLX8_9FLAO|nr:DUF6250 domain-containing protein [Seonamhaeicola maritimus]TXG39057.1 hypothetical protein FUA22_04030 [Seonamhaeicola maritimus]